MVVLFFVGNIDAATLHVLPSNPRYFTLDGVHPIYLTGSHTWNDLQDWGTGGTPQSFDFTAYVNMLSAHGHNFTLLWRIELPKFCNLPATVGSPPDFTVDGHPWQRTGPGNATDGKLKFDLTKFNQTFFDKLRSRVVQLNAAGIFVGVYLFTGEFLAVYRCPTDGYPLTGANNINSIDDGGGIGSMTMTSPNSITAIQDAYVEKVIDTLSDLQNVVWIVSEEAPYTSTWWNNHLISHIRAYEAAKPFQHPIGYGVTNDYNDTIITNSDADWIAPIIRVSPATQTCGSGIPACKVVINDSDHSYFGMWNDTAAQNRNYIWENFLNGNNVIFMDPYIVYYPRENRNLCTSPVNGICASEDPRWNNFRDNLGATLRFAKKIDLAKVTPQPSLCSTGFCLANGGVEYLVYQPNSGGFTVKVAATTYQFEWFNPQTNSSYSTGSVTTTAGDYAFTPPFSGDAVLWLRESTLGALDTTITAAPSNLTSSTSASFSFTATEAGSTFECSLDGVAFSVCTNPKRYTKLKGGTHSFQVRATNAFSTDPTPASFNWTIDTTPPNSTITSAPSGVTNNAVATFTFTSSESNGGFLCSVDRSPFAPCTSPFVSSPLPDGKHGFQVKAVDAAGNADRSAAKAKAWTVDTKPPDTIITKTPANPTTSTSAGFSFKSTEKKGAFECTLDGAAFTACKSGQTYTGLPNGNHNFQVRAIDAAGNSDPTPAFFNWLIE